MRLRPFAHLAGLVLVLGTSGCLDRGYETTDLSGKLEVSPSFYAAPETDAGWNPVPFEALVDDAPVAVTWESSDATVATVSGTGVAQPLKAGFTAITATQGAIKKSASLTVSAIPGTLVQSGVAVTNISGAQGDGKLYRIFAPAGMSTLTFTLSGGTGDVDIYVRHGDPATLDDYDDVSWNGGNGESVVVANPAAGRWYVYLDFYAASAGATLLVTLTP